MEELLNEMGIKMSSVSYVGQFCLKNILYVTCLMILVFLNEILKNFWKNNKNKFYVEEWTLK